MRFCSVHLQGKNQAQISSKAPTTHMGKQRAIWQSHFHPDYGYIKARACLCYRRQSFGVCSYCKWLSVACSVRHGRLLYLR